MLRRIVIRPVAMEIRNAIRHVVGDPIKDVLMGAAIANTVSNFLSVIKRLVAV